jgi:hypothetical protein
VSEPGGLCQCGCGEHTRIAPRNRPSRGWIKGQPLRFIKGHSRRKSGRAFVVDPATGCWVWQRHIDEGGYGVTWDGKRLVKAHVAMYRAKYGDYEGTLDHTCRNRACVNPDHLEPMTLAENCRRGDQAKLTWPQVHVIRAASRERGSAGRLARRFGVTRETIYNVWHGRTWSAA